MQHRDRRRQSLPRHNTRYIHYHTQSLGAKVGKERPGYILEAENIGIELLLCFLGAIMESAGYQDSAGY